MHYKKCKTCVKDKKDACKICDDKFEVKDGKCIAKTEFIPKECKTCIKNKKRCL